MLFLLIGGLLVLTYGTMLSTPGVLPTEFVVRGPFRYLRSPMSLGAVTMSPATADYGPCRTV